MEREADELVSFIRKYGYLSDFYAIDYLTTTTWSSIGVDVSNTTPVEKSLVMNDGVSSNSPEDTSQAMNRGCRSDKLSIDMQEYIEEAKKLGLSRIPTTTPITLHKDLLLGMNTKKQSEITHLCSTITQIASSLSVNYILDLGCGQGYLSSTLALEYGYNVVGVDSDVDQIKGAKDRYQHISKLIVHHQRPLKGSLNFLLKHVSIEESMDDLIEYVEKECGLKGKCWLVVGLHTCGDLAVSMIRGFCKSKANIRGLVNLGCCYQKLTEYDSDGRCDQNHNGNYQSGKKVGFPMSKYLKDIRLGSNIRMVACQPTKRLQDPTYFQTSIKRLFYRSVFQRILFDLHLIDSQGRIKNGNGFETFSVKKIGNLGSENPITYVNAAFQRLNLDIDISDDVIMDVFKKYEWALKDLEGIWMLRGMLAESVESLILIDRCLFALECGLKCEIVPIVDQFVSPRNMAIIVTR